MIQELVHDGSEHLCVKLTFWLFWIDAPLQKLVGLILEIQDHQNFVGEFFLRWRLGHLHLIYWLSSAITCVKICNATLTVNVHGVETTATRRLDRSSTLLVFLVVVHLIVVVEYELL